MKHHSVLRACLVLAALAVLRGPVAASDATPAATPTPNNTAPAELALVNRLSWGGMGQVPGGLTGAQWLEEQLHPSDDDGLPPQVQDQIDALDISHRRLSDTAARLHELQRRARAARADGQDAKTARQPYRRMLQDMVRQTRTRALLRDLYSRNQLKERLVWFWMNHFNVYARKAQVGALVGDFEETAIRPHVLGKFRDLLAATVFHPAMLQYLDNQQNAADKINENYAREIMELHTMGVGSGYTQKDVEALAHILTGLGVNTTGQPRVPGRFNAIGYRSNSDKGGLTEFIPRRHDNGDKTFLGHAISGAGLREIQEAIALLAAQPATARHIATELAVYFCCDAPPPRLVDAMAATFLGSDGDIAAVLKTLFDSPEFAASLGHKFKDPVQWTLSALRAGFADRIITNPLPALQMLQQLGAPFYGHETPDGYAMTEAAWSSPGQMQTRFTIARQIGAGAPRLFLPPDSMPPDSMSRAPMLQDGNGAQTGNRAIAARGRPPLLEQTAFWRAKPLTAATRRAIALGKTQAERNMLFLSSPDFMRN